MDNLERIKKQRADLLSELYRDSRPVYAPEIHRQKTEEIEAAYQSGLSAIMRNAEERHQAASARVAQYKNPFAVYAQMTTTDLERTRMLLPFVKGEFTQADTARGANDLLRAALDLEDKALILAAHLAADEVHQGVGFHPFETPRYNRLIGEAEAAIYPPEWLSQRQEAESEVADAEAAYNAAERHTEGYKNHIADSMGVMVEMVPDPF